METVVKEARILHNFLKFLNKEKVNYGELLPLMQVPHWLIRRLGTPEYEGIVEDARLDLLNEVDQLVHNYDHYLPFVVNRLNIRRITLGYMTEIVGPKCHRCLMPSTVDEILWGLLSIGLVTEHPVHKFPLAKFFRKCERCGRFFLAKSIRPVRYCSRKCIDDAKNMRRSNGDS